MNDAARTNRHCLNGAPPTERSPADLSLSTKNLSIHRINQFHLNYFYHGAYGNPIYCRDRSSWEREGGITRGHTLRQGTATTGYQIRAYGAGSCGDRRVLVR